MWRNRYHWYLPRSTDHLCQLSVSLCCSPSIPFWFPLWSRQVSLAQSPDIEVSRQACGALANIAEDVEAHPNMVYEQSMHFLVFLMRSRHLDVHREATRAVANLLSSRENHAVFLEEDGLKSLFRIAKSLDAECEYHAALCFRKLR